MMSGLGLFYLQLVLRLTRIPFVQELSFGEPGLSRGAIQHHNVYAVSEAGEAGAGGGSLAGFDALPPLLKKLVCVDPDLGVEYFLEVLVVEFALVVLSAGYLHEFLIAAGVLGQFQHVSGAGEVQGIGQAVGVGEAGLGHSQLLSHPVHLLDESSDEWRGVLVQGDVDGLNVGVLLVLGLHLLVE